MTTERQIASDRPPAGMPFSEGWNLMSMTNRFGLVTGEQVYSLNAPPSEGDPDFRWVARPMIKEVRDHSDAGMDYSYGNEITRTYPPRRQLEIMRTEFSRLQHSGVRVARTFVVLPEGWEEPYVDGMESSERQRMAIVTERITPVRPYGLDADMLRYQLGRTVSGLAQYFNGSWTQQRVNDETPFWSDAREGQLVYGMARGDRHPDWVVVDTDPILAYPGSNSLGLEVQFKQHREGIHDVVSWLVSNCLGYNKQERARFLRLADEHMIKEPGSER